MVKTIIIKLVKFYYSIRYIFTGKTRKDAFINKIKKNGGKFVAYNNKHKTGKRYNKAPTIH